MPATYLTETDTDWYNQRLQGAILIVILVFLILVTRLFFLQVIEGKEFRRLSENNRIRPRPIDAPRGIIYDRNGKILVDNRPSFDVAIVPKDTHSIEQTIQKLSEYLNLDMDALLLKAKEKKTFSYKPIVLIQDIKWDELAVIEAHNFDLPGIVINVKTRRHYVERESAAHLIGYLSEISSRELANQKYKNYRPGDYIGKFGIEKAYEKDLKGKRGGQLVEVNVTGQVVRILKTVDAQPGANILLTIDQRMQHKAERLLEGVAGSAVVMKVNSGELLALASSPSFDQNMFVGGMTRSQWNDLISNPLRPMENKVIQGEYPPASTYKIITAMAGLEEGVISEVSTFFCPGHYKYGDRIFRCWRRGGHGTVNVVEALEASCDVFFYQTGQKLGVDRIAWYAKAAGFGQETGIILDHEANGLIPTAEWKKKRFKVSWQGGETLSLAIGQGYNLATPLQILVMTAAIANGGIRYQPILLKEIKTADGKTVKKKQAIINGRLPIRQTTLELIRQGLYRVVNGEHGTAKIARLAQIKISGKTGTAQVVGRKATEITKKIARPDHLKAHAWFVAFAPAKNPEIAITVMVEHGEHGSSTAAPIARELAKIYFEK